MAEVHTFPFRQLDAPDTLMRYLEGDPELESLLGARPRSAEGFGSAPFGAARSVPRAELVEVLESYARRHEAPEAVLESARKLADESVHVIVTGQQPGLFGGPLYTLHKAATAIRLARELTAAGKPCVPLFWNHSDDHDFDEVNRAFLINPNLELQRFRVDVEPQGRTIRDVPVGPELRAAIHAATDLLPSSEFRDEVLETLAPRSDDESLAASFARLLFRTFGDHGLLVIEPRDLPESGRSVLPSWRERCDDIRGRVRDVGEHLSDVGIDVTLDPSAPLMFQCGADAPRKALADVDVPSEGSLLSPSVLLRPLWQDHCLPTVGFVVGPGELAYLSIVGPLYRLLDVPRPAFVPRASLTLTTQSLTKHFDRFGFGLADLRKGPEFLLESIGDEGDSPAERELRELQQHLRERLGVVGQHLRETDRALVGPLDKSKNRIGDELGKLEQKIANARQNRQGSGLRQAKRLCSTLAPRGRFQERILGPLSFLVTHGFDLADRLVEVADPFRDTHGMLEL